MRLLMSSMHTHDRMRGLAKWESSSVYVLNGISFSVAIKKLIPCYCGHFGIVRILTRMFETHQWYLQCVSSKLWTLTWTSVSEKYDYSNKATFYSVWKISVWFDSNNWFKCLCMELQAFLHFVSIITRECTVHTYIMGT